jgi:aspartate/methionine/tyrosine aminotransferase
VPVASTIRDGRFTLDRIALDAACSPRCRALLLNDPWNPVGTVFTPGELKTIVDFVIERDLIVYDGRRHISPASLPDAHSRTILVNSLSKTYAMTGWRVGYCAAPVEITRAMLLLLQQFSRGPATFVQDAAVCALESSQDSVHQMAAEYQARRDQVVSALEGLPGIRPLIPDGGLFVMADLRDALAGWAPPTTSDVGCVVRSGTHRIPLPLGEGGRRPGEGMPVAPSPSDSVRRFLLEKHGLVVIHGSAYGPSGEGLLRISFAAGGDTLTRGLSLLRTGLFQVATGEWQQGQH